MTRSGSKPEADGDLKNKQSVRTALIPDPWGAQLLDIANNMVANGSEWLCPRPDGEPYNEA